MNENPYFLIEILNRADVLSALNMRLVQAYMARWNCCAFQAILQTNLLSEADLADAMARVLGLTRYFHCRSLPVDDDTLQLIPYQQAKEWECLPLGVHEGDVRRIELVVADPTRRKRFSSLLQPGQVELTLAVSERSDIVGAIDELYPLSEQVPTLFGE